MKKAKVYNLDVLAGIFAEIEKGKKYTFTYEHGYAGLPISVTMPISQLDYTFTEFPAFFDGLLPEGTMLDALLRAAKVDKDDYFSQLTTVGHDLVGSITVEEFYE